MSVQTARWVDRLPHLNDGTVAEQNDLFRDRGTRCDIPLVVVIFGFETAFNSISYPTHGRVCGEGHPLFLIRG